jgi:hypothetical protein
MTALPQTFASKGNIAFLISTITPFPDEEYHRQKKLLEMELESLVIPEANAAEEAGKMIMDLPRLWSKANQEERRRLLLTMLDAVYVDAKKSKSVVAIKPKPPFKPVFQVAASRNGSDIRILNEPLNDSCIFLVKKVGSIPHLTHQF